MTETYKPECHHTWPQPYSSFQEEKRESRQKCTQGVCVCCCWLESKKCRDCTVVITVREHANVHAWQWLTSFCGLCVDILDVWGIVGKCP